MSTDPLIAIWHCCRDWPVYPFFPVGRCGHCGERPTPTDKSVEQYRQEMDTDESSRVAEATPNAVPLSAVQVQARER